MAWWDVTRQCQNLSCNKELPTDRLCEICGTPLVRKDRESYVQFARRKTDKLECYQELNRRKAASRYAKKPGRKILNETKPCEICGETLTRRYGESHSNFAKRRTCRKRECVAEVIRRTKAKNGTDRKHNRRPVKPKTPFCPAPDPEPLSRYTQVDTPLEVGIERYRMRQVAWLLSPSNPMQQTPRTGNR